MFEPLDRENLNVTHQGVYVLHEADWAQHRLGRATASRISEAVATIKSGGWGASRARYSTELVLERLTGTSKNGYQSADMAWGIQQEPSALAAYELDKNVDLIRAPEGHRLWVPHNSLHAGATPDALIGTVGGLELKCPASHTHLQALDGDHDLKKSYRLQCAWHLICQPQRQWWDWMSYDPRFPVRHQMVTQRLTRFDLQKDIDYLEAEIPRFLAGVDETVSRYS